MTNSIQQAIADIELNYSADSIYQNISKIDGTAEFYNGQRVYWYYSDDIKFWEEQSKLDQIPYNPKAWARDQGCSGIIIGYPDADPRYIEAEKAIVVIDKYPTEKTAPEIDWVSLGRLIDNKDLVELF